MKADKLNHMLSVGQPFPPFDLPDQDGNRVTSKLLAGTRYVVFFYPKDDTSGCTVEACEFRDALPKFDGIPVFGVSPDGIRSHRKFADKFALNYVLLADENRELIEPVGVWVEKSMYGKKYMGVQRSTFLVGEDGRIKKVWEKVTPTGHAAQVLEALSV